MKPYKNPFGGAIDYLRISITDRCNLRCVYCMPPEGVTPSPHESILTYEEICTLVEIGVQHGIRKVRITGGEPLVRRDVISLITSLNQISGLEEITLTTNGVCISEFAPDLKAAGISRINISLDTLSREKFTRITRRDDLDSVLRGIDTVLQMGFEPVKINVVAMKGLNDDEIADFGKLTIDRSLHVRFIEFMSLGGFARKHSSYFFPADMVQKRLERVGPLEPVNPIKGNGPARYFTYPNALGTVGLISPLSHGFCEMCNRLRVTADGKLRPCLLSDVELDVKRVLRMNGGKEAVSNLFQQAMVQKTFKLEMNNSNHRFMRSIGG
ncbi:MAG: GTP 3',8-cyclase MoaA [Gemmatimonadota bacterium]|nr:MAG: GTP 3',8-cyclase MoaA [Gemmatimonadota bacterium]